MIKYVGAVVIYKIIYDKIIAEKYHDQWNKGVTKHPDSKKPICTLLHQDLAKI